VYSEDWLRDFGYLPKVGASVAKVRDLMREKNKAVLFSIDSLSWAVRQAGERGVRPLPVQEGLGGPLLGIFDEDRAVVLMAEGADLDQLKVTDCMTSAPPVLDANAPWQEAVEALKENESVLVDVRGEFRSLDRRDLLQALKRLDHNA
jgi:predicted transcriptional regulator